MPAFFLATIEDERGQAAAAVVEDNVHVLDGRPSMAELLADWEAAVERVASDVEQGSLGAAIPAQDARFLPPVPAPPNVYMAGANYADHAREMRGLAPDDPVEKPADGPFIFLKPTTALVGHGGAVRLPSDYERVDWEVELAAVIGRRAHKVAAADALSYVAGYTIVNDISVRDAFRRSEDTELPMRFDWFAQKGRETSCPCGPWLLPSRFCEDPGDLAVRLSVNGSVEQDARTSDLIFSVEELVEYVSGVLPLVPGDIIATGTPSGVGAGKGRFLKAGDVVVAEIERIGLLRNNVVAASS